MTQVQHKHSNFDFLNASISELHDISMKNSYRLLGKEREEVF